MIVVDTNIIAYFYLPSLYSRQAELAQNKDAQWVAPHLWRSEFRNILALHLRQQLMTLDNALAILQQAEELMQGNEYEIPSAQILRLADASGCTAYDCEFVALAQNLGIPLITADKKLLRAFPSIALTLEQFVAT
ncbi:MAG: type II toxin-antitoxin system VapC family toxin [Caldilineaceae bacterium]